MSRLLSKFGRAAVVSFLALATAAPPALAQTGQRVALDLGANSGMSITIAKGQAAAVEFPGRIGEMVPADDKIAGVTPITNTHFTVIGKAVGRTNVLIYDAAGKRIGALDVKVEPNIVDAVSTVRALVPAFNGQVIPVGEGFALTGTVADPADAKAAEDVLKAFAGTGVPVINRLTIATPQMVMVSARIVEVSRSTVKQLGLNSSAILGQLGGPQYKLMNASTFGVNGSFLGGAAGGYSMDTTTQPVSTLASALGNIAGLRSPAAVASAVINFLTGGATPVTQSGPLQQYISAVAGKTTAIVTSGTVSTTYTMGDVGITADNLNGAVQGFLNGGGTTAGNSPRNIWLSNFVNNVNTGLPPGDTLYIDRNNPAATLRTGLAGSSGVNQASSMLQAFERNGVFRTLAEPTVVTASGQMGKLNSGGEFPVPTGQDSTGRTTIEFKEYGVSLEVTPTVMTAGQIQLKVATDISDLSSIGGFTLSNGNGTSSLTVPSLIGNKSNATIMVPSGGSVMVSSLLKQVSKETIDSLPGLGGPLGMLFRSRDYQQGDAELAIIITATLANSVDGSQLQTPADNLEFASDLETVLLGRLNKPLKRPAGLLPRPYQGPIGYVIE